MRHPVFVSVVGMALFLAASTSRAGENLKINPHLDYSSDSQDGPLITGDRMDEAIVAHRVNYVIMYGEGCYNSKRQARRTVQLYEKYRGQVNFVIIDLDHPLSSGQSELVRKHYQGSIPHVLILDKAGKSLHDAPGEFNDLEVAALFDKALAQ
jgi:thioredoxin-related protein